MDDRLFEQSLSRTLDDAVDMTEHQVGRTAGQILSLHGITASSATALWQQLSEPDRIQLAVQILSLFMPH